MREQLKDIVSLRAGYQFRGRFEPDPKGTVSVVQIKDLDDERRLRLNDLDRTNLEKSIEPYRVNKGDVLFLSRGNRLFGTPIDDRLHDTIASSYFFILTPTSRSVRHGYLAWYLNQPVFQAGLRPFVKGSHIPLVSKSDLAEQWIEVPDLEIQHAIIGLDGLYRQEQRLTAEIQSKRAQLIQAVCLNAARSNQ